MGMALTIAQHKDELPTDIEGLRRYCWDLSLAMQQLSQKYQKLLRLKFGQSTEKLTDTSDLDAIQLEMDALLDAALLSEQQLSEKQRDQEEETIEIPAHRRRRKNPGRNAIPEELVTEKVIDLAPHEKQCGCCGKELNLLGTRPRTVVERIPATWSATRYLIREYACGSCKGNGVTSAEPPVTTLPRTIAGLELLTFVTLSKYQYHLPLYRIQRQIFHESRMWFTRSTLVSWVRIVAETLGRIHDELLAEYRAARIKHADETRLPLQDKGKCREAWMWVGLSGDGRTAAFLYNRHRSTKAAEKLLVGSKPGDFLMTDDCASYRKPIRTLGLISLHCFAHIRRKFFEAHKSGYCSELNKRILIKIGQLYRIERLATSIGADTCRRSELRTKYSRRICQEIKGLLDKPPCRVLPKSDTGQAVAHLLNNWTAATRFLESGDLPIDNTANERIIRPMAIGRNNWKNVGSEDGARWMACLYSIITTCTLNGIDPEQYIKDVLLRVSLRSEEQTVKDLTPIQWYKAQNNGQMPPKTPLYPSKS